MELVKQMKKKRKNRYRESKLSIFSFICALLTLAYFNIFLMTLDGIDILTNLFLQILPTIGILTALLSFTRVNHKKTFAYWSLALYLFIVICIVVVGFFELSIYPKP
ncbi:hypothetical protein [Oceanobacillus bengalensis]|uniref:Uncharacterized protein n=1 Tax=Oceanobacillus bengalensis TaxID=1435466 RepID=A0A494Z556_9BACI|nr:hypothetical protein [Oceanobacillus bengalensis]RKQ17641.1 hypothetical protein D8M05_04380 [Oceanobacillus bengalensis]